MLLFTGFKAPSQQKHQIVLLPYCAVCPLYSFFVENVIAACQVVQFYTVFCGIHSCLVRYDQSGTHVLYTYVPKKDVIVILIIKLTQVKDISIATGYGVIVSSTCGVCSSVCAVRFMVTRIPSFWEARHRSRPALCPRLWPGSLRRRGTIYCPSLEPPCHLLPMGMYSSQLKVGDTTASL